MTVTLVPERSAPVRLLMIEDSPSDAMLLEAVLRDSVLYGATIEHDSTLAAALQRLDTCRFDAVLLDLGLPDSEGWTPSRRSPGPPTAPHS